MVKQKEGPSLILEHMILYQMLADRRFWELCPEWLDLKDEGEEHHDKVVQSILGKKKCVDCSSVKGVLRPLLAKFAKRIAEWHENSPEKLDSLVAYLTRKRGYRPQPIIVYYKSEDGSTRKIAL